MKLFYTVIRDKLVFLTVLRVKTLYRRELQKDQQSANSSIPYETFKLTSKNENPPEKINCQHYDMSIYTNV